MKKITIPMFLSIFCMIIINMYIVLSIAFQKDTSSDVVRLHVLPNSNSVVDKIAKLVVYSKIDGYLKENDISINNIEDENINDILEISNNVLEEKNLTYVANAKIGMINYDSKSSALLDMPAGSYNSVEIILGEGKGQNIWTLMYPNKEDFKNISSLETLVPGINKVFDNNGDSNVFYSSFILENLNRIKNFTNKNKNDNIFNGYINNT